MKISIVIPAKGHSTRVKNKNLYKINGKSLVYRACEKILSSTVINEFFLDTEDDFIIRECADLIPNGLQIIKRPIELASNFIGANELMIWALHSIPYCDLLLQTFSTSPLLTIKTIDKAINDFINSREYDSFFTVQKIQEYFWDEHSKEINFNYKQLPNSFELPIYYQETHGLYGILTTSLLKNKTRIGNKPLYIEIPKIESMDIDTAEDLKIIETILRDQESSNVFRYSL